MNKMNSKHTKDRVLYQLWGNDTFSNELYSCGVYRHRSSANRAIRKHEESVKGYQSEGLRDTFWVSAITEAEYGQQLINRKKTIEIRHKLLMENNKFVKENCGAIYVALANIDDEDIKLPRKNEVRQINLIQIPDNLLFQSIAFYLTKLGRKYEFQLCVSIKETEYTEGTGSTICHICSGTWVDYRKRIASNLSKEWIEHALKRIVEKSI